MLLRLWHGRPRPPTGGFVLGPLAKILHRIVLGLCCWSEAGLHDRELIDDKGLHDHFIAMWGTLIGELWNLRELAEVCAKEEKYNFFITSASLNVRRGVASPPNVLAIM